MQAVNWTQVGAIATAVAAGAIVLALVAAVILARSARSVARGSQEAVRHGRRLVEAAVRHTELSESRWARVGDVVAALHQQAAATGQALIAGHTPLLVPTRLAVPGHAGFDQPLQVLLPDGLYDAPAEQSVGAWTVEIGSRTLVVSCAFMNQGIGPAVLHHAHRIDLVRRGGDDPLYSFCGYGRGVVPVGGRALVGFPMAPSDPAHGHTLMLLDRPDDEVQLLVTVYYRSAASPHLLWTRVRFRRHLRTSPAGLLSELSVDLALPEGVPGGGSPTGPPAGAGGAAPRGPAGGGPG